jgi:tRNA nucleotidyltransferase (CCA-adding enzyme)
VSSLTTHDEVLRKALLRIKPTPGERERIMGIVSEAIDVMKRALSEVDPSLEVTLQGSLQKDTWIRSDVDADVFILFPPSYDKQRMGEIVIGEARRAFGERRVTLRYAEHPYATVRFKSVDVDFVPCYKATPPNWLSATDRTVYHTQFVNENFNSSMKDQARIFKAFLKGIGIYGAEIRVEGFSGFLSELLTLWSGGFMGLLGKLAELKLPLVVDPKGLTAGQEPRQIASVFRSDFVVIDPVDRERNVASSVSVDNLADLVWASRAFIARPSESFFSHPRTGPKRKSVSGAGLSVVCVQVPPWDAPPDVLWGQIHRIRRKIEVELSRTGFDVIRSGDWTDELKEVLIFFALEDDALPASFLHAGPSAFDYSNSEAFLAKQRSNPSIVSGPFIKNGRWMAVVRRGMTKAEDVLRSYISSDKFRAGLSDDVAEEFREARVLSKRALSSRAVTAGGHREIDEFTLGRKRWIQ